MQARFLALVLAAVLALPLPAAGAEVFINGTKVPKLTNVTLDKCLVTFDSNGDIHIDAPGYVVRTDEIRSDNRPITVVSVPQPADPKMPPGPVLPLTGTLGGPYQNERFGILLSTVATKSAPLPMKFELSVNGAVVRRFSGRDPDFVYELTPFFHKGTNRIRVTMEPEDPNAPRGPKGQDTYTLKVQTGRFSGPTFLLDQSVIEFTRDRSELFKFVKEFELTL